jgi:hypothetical protein
VNFDDRELETKNSDISVLAVLARNTYIEVMAATRTRRWGAGKAAMVRNLYATLEPAMQVDLAAHAGVSQPAVSQYLSSLREKGDVSFEDPGWLANREQLPMSYWQGYGSRFVSESCWYRIDAVNAQVDDLIERKPELIVSGDVAADAVLPWKVPVVAIVYGAVEHSAMAELGFVRADTAATASVLVRPVPDDSFVSDALDAREMRVAAHLHLVADLIGLGGDDRLEAAGRFARVGQ